MDETKGTEQTLAWLLTADRYVAEITRQQRAIRWRTAAGHIKAGQGLPKPFLASRAGWLNAAAPSLLLPQ